MRSFFAEDIAPIRRAVHHPLVDMAPSNQEIPPPQFGFTAREIKAFRIHAIIVAAFTAGIFVLLPRGLGSLVGVLFGLIVLPLPPLVVYLRRKRRVKRKPR
jgi:Flp pilus assembly protein TadB